MNILYYIPFLTKKLGGIYQYSLGLLNSAGSNNSDAHQYYVLLGYDCDEFIQLTKQYKNINLIPSKYIKEPVPHLFFRRLFKLLNIFLLKYLNFKIFPVFSNINYILRKYNIELVHSPVQGIPVDLNIPTIVTIHDVQHLYYPEFFTSEQRMGRAINFKYSIDNATVVIVSFEHVKKDIIKFFNKPENKVFVCFPGMKMYWFDNFSSFDILKLEKFDLPENFLLYPAATWQHKNHVKLLEVLNYLKESKGIKVNLICTGHKTIYYLEIKKILSTLKIQDQVSFLGVVSDQELFCLYHNARAVIIPSLYEAGSLPLFESITLKVPVICSNVTSLPDTIGVSEFVFDPMDIIDMADKIEKILFNDKYRNDNKKNSELQEKRIYSNNIYDEVVKVYSYINKK